jgi:hypothetical protein
MPLACEAVPAASIGLDHDRLPLLFKVKGKCTAPPVQ